MTYRITAEQVDVLLNPLKSKPLIVQTGIRHAIA